MINSLFTDYLGSIEQAYNRNNATEHTYRPFLKKLLEGLSHGGVEATNEPKREKCGAPDYVISRKRDQLTLGYVEAKDVDADLVETEKSEQLTRYRQHLPNLLLTNYLDFRWYVRGENGVETRGRASLGQFGKRGRIVSDPGEQANALKLIDSFFQQTPVRIVSASDLALRLAHFTHLIRDIIIESFAIGKASRQLRSWREALAATLLPELGRRSDAEQDAKACTKFADIFAQTLAYGLFSARAVEPGKTFTREQAQRLIPRSNPFLRDFFYEITGPNLDDEPFAGFVGDLVQTLAHADTEAILADFGKRGRRTDPVIHFYETFLKAYDPKLRELRGVYYTPEPIVNYIVESLDVLLKEKFAIADGLADRSKIETVRKEGKKEIRKESHRVLILDPATGTATFLYRVMDHIRDQFERKHNAGAWGDYVHEHLLPRLFGFELLMAPYAVAHFKLGLALAARDKEPNARKQWNYQTQIDERINVYLTNTLEDMGEKVAQLGPLRMLYEEANSAYEVKTQKPVLVILGNPPYSNFGQQNRHPWILGLLDDYKRGLKEKKINLNDDFIKFIRWAHWRIDQTGQGIVGYITNNVYLDGLTHRRMRESLLETFDEIYVLNLHGSAKKQETAPAGEKDDNVFDITIGVAIVLFVKLPPAAKKKTSKYAIVRHADLWGKRTTKYQWLDAHTIATTKWEKLDARSPNFFFVPKNYAQQAEYADYPSITDIFPVRNTGIQTKRDRLVYHFTEKELTTTVDAFTSRDEHALRQRFELSADGRDWRIAWAKKDLMSAKGVKVEITYRPFDERISIFTGQTKGWMAYPRTSLMQHMLAGHNLALLTVRNPRRGNLDSFFVTRHMADKDAVSPFDNASVFPLYLYPNGNLPDDDLFVHDKVEKELRCPNFSPSFVKDICARLGVTFVSEGLGKISKKQVGPELIFNYAYAVFHSPGYRERYADFLRADFPRLPITCDGNLFARLAELGGRLVDLHARGKGDGSASSFPIKGNNVVEKVCYELRSGEIQDQAGRVWVNEKQYFEGIPETVWRFPIGGYRPAERWLKDRVGRTLSFDDLAGYSRLVAVLSETQLLMLEIDAVIEKYGGWPKAFV